MAEKIIIASGKGGVGKSTAVACLARSLAAKGHRVLVMDFDIGLRSLDILLGVSDQVLFDWGDVLALRCDPKKAFLELSPNLFFIAAPLHMQKSYTLPRMRELLEILDRSFHYILMDAPAGLHQGFSLASCAADTGILLSTPDAVCVRSAGIAARTLSANGVKALCLLINRLQQKPVTYGSLLNIDEVIDAVGVQLLGVIPEDFSITQQLCKGFILPEKSPAAHAFDRVTRRMLGESVRLPAKF